MDEVPRVSPNWAHVVNLHEDIYDDDAIGIEDNTQCLTPNGVSYVGSVNEGSVLLGASGEPVNVLSRGTSIISKVIKVTATLGMGRGKHIRKTTFSVTHNQPLQLVAAALCHANLNTVGGITGQKRRVTWWTRCTQDGIHEEVASLPYEAL